MVFDHTEQLITLLTEKNSRLLHEVAELKRENRKLKKTIREREKQISENHRAQGGDKILEA